MENKSNKFGANEIFQFGLLMGAIILGYYMYTTRNIMAVKRLPKNLPQNLQDLYDQLKEKGYKPTTSPKQFSGYFISFEIGEGEDKIMIIINDKNIILFEVLLTLYILFILKLKFQLITQTQNKF